MTELGTLSPPQSPGPHPLPLPTGVLHPPWAGSARPPLPQRDPALRLRRLWENLRPLREPGTAHARPLPGGQLAECPSPGAPPRNPRALGVGLSPCL